MDLSHRIFIIVPTFKETSLVSDFLENWKKIHSANCEIIICNANPDDETSELILKTCSSYPHRLREARGNPSLYWTGLVKLGLEMVANELRDEDLLMLTNIDVGFDEDPLPPLLKVIDSQKNTQAAAVAVGANGKVLSAGIQVKSWILSVNRHLFQGLEETAIPLNQLIPANYLPTRFLLFPSRALKEAGLPDAKHLPHYGADYEYTNRMRLAGYQPLIVTASRVRNVHLNTGFKTFEQKTTLRQRLRALFDIKSTLNLKYRFWFLWLTYPPLLRPFGLISTLLKIAIEVLLSGRRIFRV